MKLFRLYNKSIQKIKNGVYLIHNIVQAPVYIVVANEIQGRLDRELAAIKMKEEGLDILLIARITGLSPEKIEEL